MEVDVRIQGDENDKLGAVIIVDLRGRLVTGVGDELLREVTNELLAEGWKRILFNMTGVSKIDSSGIGELVAGIKLAERFESSVKVLLSGGRVRDVLELSQLLPRLDVYEVEAEAVESFGDV
jgi:anti-sigma B factor antagonist